MVSFVSKRYMRVVRGIVQQWGSRWEGGGGPHVTCRF